MRGESWIVDVPPEVQADSQSSEHEALEAERLEILISTLRRGAAKQGLASRYAAPESPRSRAAREMIGEGLA